MKNIARKFTVMHWHFIFPILVLLAQAGCTNHSNKLCLTGSQDADNKVFDYLSPSHLANVRLIDMEHRECVDFYAPYIQEIGGIHRTNSSFAGAGLLNDPNAPSVRLIAEYGHDSWKHQFMREFWASNPTPDVLINWLQTAPGNLFCQEGDIGFYNAPCTL